MPAYTQPHAPGAIAITLYRDDRELSHATAADGLRAVSVAMKMLAMLDELQPGDRLTVTAIVWP